MTPETVMVVVMGEENSMRANEFLLDPNVEEFLEGLTPDDVGVDEVGDYIVHYEGFTDQCQDSEEYQNNPDAVFNDVWGDFKRRMGDQDPINYGLVGSEDYPIVYSVFKNSIKESKSDDQVAENFADGKGPGKPGDSQRHGIPKGATISQLERAAKAPGRKGQLARWQLNMRRGHKK